MRFSWEKFKKGDLLVHCQNKEECYNFLSQLKGHNINCKVSDYILSANYCNNVCFRCSEDGKEALVTSFSYYENCFETKYQIVDYKDVYEFEVSSAPELKAGMIVKNRKGIMYLVTTDIEGNLYFMGSDSWDELEFFKEDLTNEQFEDLDIMEIYTRKLPSSFSGIFDSDMLDFVWKRNEPKKMTLKEISEALGYEVEVVDE